MTILLLSKALLIGVLYVWGCLWGQDKGLEVKTLSRGQFWQLASRAAYVLRCRLGLQFGDAHVHFFTGNCVEDLAFRLAAVMVGTVPVTVNWDSDTIERILYKVQSSKAKVKTLGSFGDRPLGLWNRLFLSWFDEMDAWMDGWMNY